MTNERFAIPELLFHPSDVGIQEMGISESIMHSLTLVEKGECDSRAPLFAYRNNASLKEERKGCQHGIRCTLKEPVNGKTRRFFLMESARRKRCRGRYKTYSEEN